MWYEVAIDRYGEFSVLHRQSIDVEGYDYDPERVITRMHYETPEEAETVAQKFRGLFGYALSGERVRLLKEVVDALN